MWFGQAAVSPAVRCRAHDFMEALLASVARNRLCLLPTMRMSSSALQYSSTSCACLDLNRLAFDSGRCLIIVEEPDLSSGVNQVCDPQSTHSTPSTRHLRLAIEAEPFRS